MNPLIRSVVAATCIATTFGSMLADANASPAANSKAHRASGSYQSAFEGYDEPRLSSWRQANELVGQIGGWQAYTREAAGQEPLQGNRWQHRANAGTSPAQSPSVNLPAAPQHPTHQHHPTKP